MESPGALVELGAFTVNDDLAKIILAINDLKFKNAPSEEFITGGPLRKLERSCFGKPIYVDFRRVFAIFPEVRLRLEEQFRFRRRRLVGLRIFDQWKSSSRKHRMLFLHDLVRLFGPVRHSGLIHVLRELYGNHGFDVKLELAVLRALKLVEVVDEFYVPTTNPGETFFEYPSHLHSEIRSRVINRYHRTGKAELAVIEKQMALRCNPT
jgi:hypothetical protein